MTDKTETEAKLISDDDLDAVQGGHKLGEKLSAWDGKGNNFLKDVVKDSYEITGKEVETFTGKGRTALKGE